MAASEHLPRIKIEKAPTKREADKMDRVFLMNKTRSTGAELVKRIPPASIGRFPCVSKEKPRPGDVYRGSTHRPLGLLPDRGKTDMWKELSMLLYGSPSTERFKNEHYSYEGRREKSESNANKDFISATITPRTVQRKGTELNRSEQRRSFYRHAKPDKPDDHTVFEDQEYLNTLALCDMRDYEAKEEVSTLHDRGPCVTFDQISDRFCLQQPGGAIKSGKIRNPYKRSTVCSNLEFLSFSWQAQLNKRVFTTDHRDASDYEPCERCRLRGTRCSRCKAIRTGGGYIILDEEALSSQLLNRYTSGLPDWNSDNKKWDRDTMSSQRRRRRMSSGDELADESLVSRNDEEIGLREGKNGAGWRSNRGKGFRTGEGWDGGERESNGRGGLGQNSGLFGGHSNRSKVQVGNGLGDRSSVVFNGSRRNTGTDEFGNTGDHSLSGGQENQGYDLVEGNGGGQEGGKRRERTDRLGSARPQQALAKNLSRPPSKMGRNRGVRDREVKEGKISMEKQNRKVGKEVDMDDDLDKKGSKRRRNVGDEEGQDDIEKKTYHDYQMTRERKENEDDNDEDGFNYTGDLMRFKTKRDKVRAKSCTLRELKGIDPLDYLAKYCIIDQEKVPHYQRVFENVDMDEDGEITVNELDFGLKAVNYNLISDAELLYVNKVLELAGRYALNFQLFSLIAALSEKVVALEDMVKRLVNTMDFEALETKMKKCKELFYLLANNNDQEGVVTTAALAVELQAGGLTQEHVEFVVDRLNHEDKGTVEFLDYLTYVPLFIEIHDNISDNPLDFTRNR